MSSFWMLRPKGILENIQRTAQRQDSFLISQPMEVKALFDPLGTRRDEKNLLALANALPPGQGGGFGVAADEEPAARK